MPTDHGPGDPVVAGVLRQLLERLISVGGALEPSPSTGYTVPADPEIYKLVFMDLLDKAGVSFLFHAFASGVVESDGRRGVVFETKSGPVVVHAEVVVDCSGDGDVAAAAGAPYEVGRPEDGLVQPMTLMFRMVDVERPAFAQYVRDNPGQWRGVHGLWDLVKKASEEGVLQLPREDILFFGTPHPREVSVNSTRVGGLLALDVWDLTRAEWQTRHQMRQIVSFLRQYVPGFEESYAAQSGSNVGVREPRRITGEYQLSADDVLSARRFPDGIARGSYPIDIHNPKGGSGTVLQNLPPGEAYDIPLRCLVPQEVDWVLVAGRCISGTHEAHSSYRVTPIAMATGQAAGVCAALAASSGTPPRSVDAAEVRKVLLDQGANLG